jgi:hypothetical protein
MKNLNSYGRKYLEYLLSEINNKKCFPSVLKYLEAVERELEETGTSTEQDVLKLQQICFRTNGDSPPASPDYHLFEEAA